MLTPDEATPRALAMLTLAHELYSASDEERQERSLMDTDTILQEILRDGDDEIDWQAIAVSLSMLGHILLDHIPAIIYARTEAVISALITEHFNAVPGSVEVAIGERLTGFDILRELSLHVAKMNASGY